MVMVWLCSTSSCSMMFKVVGGAAHGSRSAANGGGAHRRRSAANRSAASGKAAPARVSAANAVVLETNC